jgi:hypothetical protein
MAEFRTIARIKAADVRSLVWSGDTLIDWVGGGVRFELDGRTASRAVNYAYRFDAACISFSGTYAVIYERLGTKGVLLREGKILREINRSFYCANVYEYPICFGRLKSGREVLVHCPDEYNQLDIDDVETGERLTRSESRKPFDFFHSRLAVDSTSAMLLSAGWVWHPFDALSVYKLDKGIENPLSLDASGSFPIQPTEISAAAFLDSDNIVIATSEESFADEEYKDNELRPESISIWSISNAKTVTQSRWFL